MRRNARKGAGNPFLPWAELAWKMGEMSIASAQVIAHRTARMAAAGSAPNARDRQEFALMGQEKIDAATESARAFAVQLTAMNLKFGARAFRHMVTGAAALTALAASRGVGQSLARQAELAEILAQSAVTAFGFSDSTARLARHSLRPIRARALANARRLGKR